MWFFIFFCFFFFKGEGEVMVVFSETSLGVVSWGGMTRGNASGFWSLTVLPGGQGFLRRLGAPRDLFEFQVRGCSQGFLCGSFGRA